MEDAQRLNSLKTIASVVYALQAFGFLNGITWIVAVIINYVKKEEVKGTWLESHWLWQIRTFWFGLLWGAIGVVLLLVLVGYFVLLANAVWIIYRIVKGWLNLAENRPIGQGGEESALPSGEAHLLGIGEDVFLQPGAHALLLAGPELRIEQIAVVLEEDRARARVGDEEALELLGVDVVRAHRPVGLGGDLVVVA